MHWFLAWWLFGEVFHELEKHAVITKARRRADELGVPLANVGCGSRLPFPCARNRAIDLADLNLDYIEHKVPNFAKIERFSPPRLPLGDKSCVVLLSHVLEHTENPDELMDEVRRVSIEAFVILPKPFFPQTWLSPAHKHIWVGRRRVRNPFWLPPKPGFIKEML